MILGFWAGASCWSAPWHTLFSTANDSLIELQYVLGEDPAEGSELERDVVLERLALL